MKTNQIIFDNLKESGINIFESNNPIISQINCMLIQKQILEFYETVDINPYIKMLLMAELAEMPNDAKKCLNEYSINEEANIGNYQVAKQSLLSKVMADSGAAVRHFTGQLGDILHQGFSDLQNFYSNHAGAINLAALAAIIYGTYRLAKKIYKAKNPNASEEDAERYAKQAQLKQLQKIQATCSKSKDPEQCRKKVQEKIKKIQNG